MYLVVSSAMRAMRDMFLATTFVLCDAAMNQAAVAVGSRLSAQRDGRIILHENSFSSQSVNTDAGVVTQERILCQTRAFVA